MGDRHDRAQVPPFVAFGHVERTVGAIRGPGCHLARGSHLRRARAGSQRARSAGGGHRRAGQAIASAEADAGSDPSPSTDRGSDRGSDPERHRHPDAADPATGHAPSTDAYPASDDGANASADEGPGEGHDSPRTIVRDVVCVAPRNPGRDAGGRRRQRGSADGVRRSQPEPRAPGARGRHAGDRPGWRGGRVLRPLRSTPPRRTRQGRPRVRGCAGGVGWTVGDAG